MLISPFALAPAIAGLIILFTGIYVFFRNPKSSLHRAYLYSAVTIFGWLGCYTMMYGTDDPRKAVDWARAGFLCIAFIAPSNFYVTLCLLNIPGKKAFMWFLGAISIFLAVLAPTPLVYAGVQKYYWGFYPVAGSFYPVFMAHYCGTWLYGLYLLYRKMTTSREARDFVTYNQSRYLFFSDLGGCLGVVDFVGKYGIPIYPFAYVIALFWLSIIAFTILRYRLLTDISFLIRRMLVASAILVIISASAGGEYLAISLLTHLVSFSNTSVLWALGCLTLGLSFSPIYRITSQRIDLFFFPEYHDRANKLALLGQEILLAKNAMEFNRCVLEGILSCFKVVRASVFVWDETQKGFILQSALGWGLQLNEEAVTRMPGGVGIARYLESREEAVLSYTKVIRDFEASSDQKALAYAMLQIEATLCLPIKAAGRLQGILVLGDKESGLPYSKEDIVALQTLAGNMSVVLENIDLTKRWAWEQNQSNKLGQVLHRYMSSSVADEIISRAQDMKAWKGDRRHAAILMSDLRGFTELSEKRPLEEVVQSLNEYFTEMTEIILSAGGNVDKFIGDAILVVFGAPVAMADPEKKAARCAVDMQNSLRAFNAKRAAIGLFPLEMGIGISAGEVVAGNIGSDKRMEYTVIGDAVNLASRIQSLAAAGQIVTTGSVAKILAESFFARGLGPMSVKGKEKPVDIFEILKPKSETAHRKTT